MRSVWWGPRAAGAGLLMVGVVALAATTAIPAGRYGWGPAGARFFPLVVSIGLIACALAHLARTTVRKDAELGEHARAEAQATDWRVPGALAVVLVGYALTLEPLGYVLSSAAFFPLAARVLGSRSPRRDVISGVALAIAVDALFTQLLAVPLPSGLVGL